jgi:hypothetical protein
MPRPFQIICLLVLSSVVSFSTSADSHAEAVVSFTLDFPSSRPEHYSIRIPSDGSAHYQSNGRVSADSDEPDSHNTDSQNNDSQNTDSQNADSRNTDSFDLDFALSPETRQKIFELAAKAGYFQKDLASHHKGLAFTGKKTLGYKDAQRSGESTYNYSTIAAVQELTSLLQSLSATLEFGHRLQYDHHYQKLALDEELKRMGEMARSNQLLDIPAIQPILDQIIADPSVMNIARARAQRLLQGAGVH